MKAKSYRKLVARQLLVQDTPLATLPDQEEAATRPAEQTVVEMILARMPDLLAVAVVDMESGRALAAHSNTPAINPQTAASYNAAVIRQKQKALAALQLLDEKIEEILITLTDQLHLLKLSTDGSRFIYLAVSLRETNLASAREVLRASVAAID